MKEKHQRPVMSECVDEQQHYVCMEKCIEELDAKVRVMAGALNYFREFYAANVWDDGERESLLESIDSALSGSVPEPFMPEGWKLVENANCFVLINDGQVIASMAGPTAECVAIILSSVLDGKFENKGDSNE